MKEMTIVSTSAGVMDHLQDPDPVLQRPDARVSVERDCNVASKRKNKTKKKKRTLVPHSGHGGLCW